MTATNSTDAVETETETAEVTEATEVAAPVKEDRLEDRLADLPEDEPTEIKLDWNERNTEMFRERKDIKQQIADLQAKDDAEGLDSIEALQLKRLASKLDDVTSRIVRFNFGLVRAYVKKFTSNTSPEDSADFEAAAVVGLMRAIDTYDMEKGRFGQWAYKPIQREVLRAVRDADHPNMNPGDFERRPDILRAKADLLAAQGHDERQPTFEAIAAKAGTTIEQVNRVLDAPHLESLSVPVGDDGETELGDLIADTSVAVDEHVMAGMTLDALQEFGLTALDARELFVIVRRFGLDAEEPQCLSSIGEMLGLSREAVRQIEAKGLAKIQHPVTLRRLYRHGR